MGPFLIFGLALALAFWAAGWRLWRLLHAAPARRATTPAAPDSLSVIIPARDEEHNLPRLLRSLQSQPAPPGEIVVVDDGSTDRTAAIARELGANLINSRPLPEGWRGKTWACHQGARAASGRWLLFLDADTWLEPGGLAGILALYPGGAFSLAPHHAVQKPYERLSLFFNLSMVLGTVPRGLFGPMLLVDRASYERAGGHEAVKGFILENARLAQIFRARDVPTRSEPGGRLLSFRMYPNGLRELAAGWTKAFAAGAGQTPQGRLLLIVAWKIGLMLPPLGWLLTGHGWIWALVYLLCALQVGLLGRAVGNFRWGAALLYPVPLLFFFALFARSALRSGRAVQWKGREIRAD